MSKLVIQGGNRLSGELCVHGAKNSALPILAATFLCRTASVIHNCPKLSDIDAAINILIHLGCKARWEGSSVIIDSSNVNTWEIPENLMREMRSSVVFLGAIVARMGKAVISAPGGCEIGLRPIDLHLSSLRKLGLNIEEEHGNLNCVVEDRLEGQKIILSFPSVGATENIILASVTAKGQTSIINAAREPEISDLADFLNRCGAKIHGAGEGVIYIEGVDYLNGAEHTVIPDRITAATYMSAAAVTRGHLILRDVIPAHLGPVVPSLEEAGCDICIKGRELAISAPPRLKRIRMIKTMPYPGFPTDAQAPIMAVTVLADGTSVFVENIFESRFKHVSELNRLGAVIKVENTVAIIEGVKKLSGASVISTDLRGAAALVVAGLAAEGVTTLNSLSHLDRGYEKIENCLSSIGAIIKREE